jgi:hypothetical protein
VEKIAELEFFKKSIGMKSAVAIIQVTNNHWNLIYLLVETSAQVHLRLPDESQPVSVSILVLRESEEHAETQDSISPPINFLYCGAPRESKIGGSSIFVFMTVHDHVRWSVREFLTIHFSAAIPSVISGYGASREARPYG